MSRLGRSAGIDAQVRPPSSLPWKTSWPAMTMLSPLTSRLIASASAPSGRHVRPPSSDSSTPWWWPNSRCSGEPAKRSEWTSAVSVLPMASAAVPGPTGRTAKATTASAAIPTMTPTASTRPRRRRWVSAGAMGCRRVRDNRGGPPRRGRLALMPSSPARGAVRAQGGDAPGPHRPPGDGAPARAIASRLRCRSSRAARPGQEGHVDDHAR